MFTNLMNCIKFVNKEEAVESMEIFAERLKSARVMKGYSMDDLVSRMDGSISKMAISKYERATLNPSSSVVIALSRALELPVDYFFRPFTLDINSIKFRKHKTRLSVKEEKAIRESVCDIIERYTNIEEICSATVDFSSPLEGTVSMDEDVVKAAEECRSKWGLGSVAIVNAGEILEEHGIKVIEIDADGSFDGLKALVNDKYPVIVLNKRFSPERKRFTLLHELGHLLIKFDSSVDEKEEERLCNLFSSEMLIPSSVFIKEIGTARDSISYQEMKALQIEYGISIDALMYKAMYLGVIKNQKYKAYCIRKNRDSSFKNMVEMSYYPESVSSRFRSLVYKALSSSFITLSKASNLLNVSLEQVRVEASFI